MKVGIFWYPKYYCSTNNGKLILDWTLCFVMIFSIRSKKLRELTFKKNQQICAFHWNPMGIPLVSNRIWWKSFMTNHTSWNPMNQLVLLIYKLNNFFPGRKFLGKKKIFFRPEIYEQKKIFFQTRNFWIKFMKYFWILAFLYCKEDFMNISIRFH